MSFSIFEKSSLFHVSHQINSHQILTFRTKYYDYPDIHKKILIRVMNIFFNV
jgi:hypothetical protein